MQTPFFVTKLSAQEAKLPNGQTITRSQFLSRMAKCGFEAETTELYFDRIRDNGGWALSLTPRQIRRLNGNSQKRTNGFA